MDGALLELQAAHRVGRGQATQVEFEFASSLAEPESDDGRVRGLRHDWSYMALASDLRAQFAQLVGFERRDSSLEVLSERHRDGYVELQVRYPGVEDDVPALLLAPDPAGPDAAGPFPAVLALHQHNAQWHLGKSEVAGLAGDPLQAFGPALARAGVVVLAPDAVGFEDRRFSGAGVEQREDDWLQYFNEMAFRLVSGGLLATTVLGDAAAGLSALTADERVDSSRLGVLGHSYGGNVTIMLAALDERVRFACASGSACSYQRRMQDRTGIEFAHVIPGVTGLADIQQLVALVAPRPLLLVSATDDRYSADAPEIVAAAAGAWESSGSPKNLLHLHYNGGHALTSERAEQIISWTLERAGA